MLRQMLLSKIHRATVTACDLNYNGSISIDEDLLEACGMREFERVEIFNINNGARFSTYIILGKGDREKLVSTELRPEWLKPEIRS